MAIQCNNIPKFKLPSNKFTFFFGWGLNPEVIIYLNLNYLQTILFFFCGRGLNSEPCIYYALSIPTGFFYEDIKMELKHQE